MWIRPNRLILSLKVTKSEFKNLVMVKAHHYFGFSNCCTILVSIILRDSINGKISQELLRVYNKASSQAGRSQEMKPEFTITSKKPKETQSKTLFWDQKHHSRFELQNDLIL